MIVDIDIDKISIYNKVSFGEKGYKYFIGYKDVDYKIPPLCIMLAKLSKYVNSLDESEYKSNLIKGDELLKKCDKVCSSIKKDLIGNYSTIKISKD